MLIKSLRNKQFETQRGIMNKVYITDETGRMYDAFIGDWNKDWQVGQTIDIPVDRIKNHEYNGKIYYTIYAPKIQGQKQFFNSNEQLSRIEKKLDEIIKIVGFETTKQDENIVDVDNLPF
jgi:hypothetical protein